jgi:ABC-type phosphate transport system substrate-binding protein
MKNHFLVKTTLIFVLGFAMQSTLAKDVYVIANPGLAVSEADIRDIFTGEKQIASGTKIVPAENGSLQADFLAKVIKMDATKYNAMWTKKAFRDGVAVPAVKGGDAEVAAYVRSTPGAVGYVSAPSESVKVLGKF